MQSDAAAKKTVGLGDFLEHQQSVEDKVYQIFINLDYSLMLQGHQNVLVELSEKPLCAI